MNHTIQIGIDLGRARGGESVVSVFRMRQDGSLKRISSETIRPHRIWWAKLKRAINNFTVRLP